MRDFGEPFASLKVGVGKNFNSANAFSKFLFLSFNLFMLAVPVIPHRGVGNNPHSVASMRCANAQIYLKFNRFVW